ncbi:MAG: hypothetical protein P8Y97_07930 [Candidatus Lokiarchaeota archaeon]
MRPIEINEYENFPHPVEISINNLEKFYSEFKNKFTIKPNYDTFEKIKENIIKNSRYNKKSQKFQLDLGAKYYIGIIKLPNDQTVIIKPKVGNNVKFLHMFEYVNPQYAQIFYDITQKIKPESDFLHILINRFISLIERLIRTSLMKNYKPVLNCLNNIKGKIAVRESIKRPYFLRGKLVCGYDDFSFDIVENQIVKLALYKLRFIANKKQQKRIQGLLSEMHKVSLREFKVEDIEKIKYQRFNYRYKKIHNYCKMIIGRFSFGFETGNNEWFSMLLNSWDIYERFLRKILEKYLKKILGSNFLIEKRNIGKIQSWDKNKLTPDIILLRNSEILLLFDAKYKLESSNEDRRQGREYIHEFLKKNERGDVEFKVRNRNLLLIYPDNESNNYEFKLIENKPLEKFGYIFAHSIDLTKIDNKIYLESWVRKIANKLL